MLRHVLGLSIFAAIVASSVLFYSLLPVPGVPPLYEVAEPVSRTGILQEGKAKCGSFTHHIIKSEYSFRGERLVSRVKLKWNGQGPAPRTVYASAQVFTLDQFEKFEQPETEMVSPAFDRYGEATVTIVSRLSRPVDPGHSHYVNFGFTHWDRNGVNIEAGRRLAGARQITFRGR